jgi:hypothetical protein
MPHLPLALSFLCVTGFCQVSFKCVSCINFVLSEAPIFQMHVSYKLYEYSTCTCCFLRYPLSHSISGLPIVVEESSL